MRAKRSDLVRGIREADVLRNLRLLRVGQLACGDSGIDPHRRSTLGHRGLAFGEAAARRAGIAVLADEIDVELDGLRGCRRSQLWLPFQVEPLAAEGVDHR